ncbi:hypothetical protein IQ241_06870 [Romeria aff. gracilis LEGE 07310]|uniref:Addiction module component n=1 Tax=Vasconcelosia minhoensis LEGE 07310 TaxID=915328 RepID=A0A8J7AA96_9CYAN|nr:hypothetical protein [Romeria gracilis]MBE9077021.1 hypothetical protein [Romeria aff. gracilis LEGE 07310]
MSPTLQRVMSDLKQLTLNEQWKLVGYLMNQLQSKVQIAEALQPEVESSTGAMSIDELLEETRGSWGDRSPEAIDAELARLRQIDWGE